MKIQFKQGRGLTTVCIFPFFFKYDKNRVLYLCKATSVQIILETEAYAAGESELIAFGGDDSEEEERRATQAMPAKAVPHAVPPIFRSPCPASMSAHPATGQIPAQAAKTKPCPHDNCEAVRSFQSQVL
jgi:hypothetical protein